MEESDSEPCTTEENIESYSYTAAPNDNITTVTCRPSESYYQYVSCEDEIRSRVWSILEHPTLHFSDGTTQDITIER